MSKPPFSKVPLLFPSAALAAGIWVGSFSWAPAVLAAALVLAVVALLRRLSVLLAVSAIFAVGTTESYLYELNRWIPPADTDRIEYRAIIKNAKFIDRGQSLTVEITHWGADSTVTHRVAPFYVRLTAPDFTPQFHTGQTIRFRAAIEPIEARTDLPDEIDPVSNILRQHIFYRAIEAPEHIIVVSEPAGLMACLRNLGEKAEELLLESDLNPATKTFLAAAILGDDSLIDTDTRTTFAQTGLAHILALSGLHVGIIAMLISMALYPLIYFRKRRLALVITLVVLWLYAFATGLPPSVVRAVTMASVYSLARLFQRRQSPLNSLCFSAMVILLFSPESLFNIGFQLTFAAVLCIILFADKLIFISRRKRLAYNIAAYLAVSISAMTGTSLLSVIYFHTFPVYFLICNLFASLLLPFIVAGGLLTIILQWMGLSLAALTWCVDAGYFAIEALTGFTASLPGSYIDEIYLPGWTMIPYTLSIAMLAYAIHAAKHKIWALAGIVTSVTVIIIALSTVKPVESRIYMAHQTQRTDIIVPTEHVLNILTTGTARNSDHIRNEAKMRYGQFMAHRGIDSLAIIHLNSGVYRIGQLWFVNSDSVATRPPLKVKYLAVGRGYHGKIVNLTKALHPDTVILCSDINEPNLTYCINECRRLQMPCVAIRNTPFSIHREATATADAPAR